MLITNHVAGGAVLGAVAPGPVSAFVAGVVSHFVMDAAPHWGGVPDDDFLDVAVRDGLTGLVAMAWLTRAAPASRRATVLAGMLGACLPDSDKPALLFLGRSPFPGVFDRWHAMIQHEQPDRMPQEVAFAVVGLVAATRLLRRVGRDTR